MVLNEALVSAVRISTLVAAQRNIRAMDITQADYFFGRKLGMVRHIKHGTPN